MYIDTLVDDLWCHAKGQPCHRPLDAVVLELVEWLNESLESADGTRTRLFQFYIDDLKQIRKDHAKKP